MQGRNRRDAESMISAAFRAEPRELRGRLFKVYENAPEDTAQDISKEIGINIDEAVGQIADLLIEETGRFAERNQRSLLGCLRNLDDALRLYASPETPGNCSDYALFGIAADGVKDENGIARELESAKREDAMVMKAAYRKIYAVGIEKSNEGCLDPKDPGKAWLRITLKEIGRALMDALLREAADGH